MQPKALQMLCFAGRGSYTRGIVARQPLLSMYEPTCLKCRAKLEEALERMDRVVQAIERDADPASPYNPALLQMVDNDSADTLSPALQQARSCSQHLDMAISS